jgi:Domain of unknown function (DUF892)
MKTALKKAPVKRQDVSSMQQSAMPQHSGEATGLGQLFEDSLKDIYWAEKALTQALSKMIKQATSKKLVTAITDHLAVQRYSLKQLHSTGFGKGKNRIKFQPDFNLKSAPFQHKVYTFLKVLNFMLNLSPLEAVCSRPHFLPK